MGVHGVEGTCPHLSPHRCVYLSSRELPRHFPVMGAEAWKVGKPGRWVGNRIRRGEAIVVWETGSEGAKLLL
jgi:hypothetical protein